MARLQNDRTTDHPLSESLNVRSPMENNTRTGAFSFDTFIRLALLVGLFVWCSLILAPFIYIVIWGMILAISTFPAFVKLRKAMGGHDKAAALLVTVIGLAIFAVPGYFILNSIIASVTEMKNAYAAGTLALPHPPDEVESWPLIGKPLHEIWSLASTNITEAINRYESQLLGTVTWVAGGVGKIAFALVKFLFSIIIAGVFLMYSKSCERFTDSFFTKLLGTRGPLFADIAEKTIRNVARGIIGVAFIQAIAAAIGFYLGGIPFAGPLTVLCLVLCIIQIGVGIVVIPVMIYAFSTFGTLHAVLLSSWLTVIMFSDNILKPIFLGKGAPVPTMIIFLGSIGGFLLSGIIGLFIGAVILSLGYRLFMTWIETEVEHIPVTSDDSPKANRPL